MYRLQHSTALQPILKSLYFFLAFCWNVLWALNELSKSRHLVVPSLSSPAFSEWWVYLKLCLNYYKHFIPIIILIIDTHDFLLQLIYLIDTQYNTSYMNLRFCLRLFCEFSTHLVIWGEPMAMSQSFSPLTSSQISFCSSSVSPPVHPTDLLLWIELSLPQTLVRLLMGHSAHIYSSCSPT